MMERSIKVVAAIIIEGDKFFATQRGYGAWKDWWDCFICSIISGELTLLEHEAARWLPLSDPWHVKWLPSDIEVVEQLKKRG